MIADLDKYHIMVDNETLGNGPDSSIIQIGATIFHPLKEIQGLSKFSVFVKEINGSVNIDTVCFWLSQPYAPKISEKIQKEGVSLKQAMTQFIAFCNSINQDIEKTPVWAHGADFDIPILRNAAERCGLKLPWRYNYTRDCRTLYAIKGKPTLQREGIHHDALDDCIYQAKCVQEVLNRV